MPHLAMTDRPPSSRAGLTAWRIVNVITLVVVLAANGAAGSGAMSGESIGVIANRYRSDFLPANYVFGIWSLIYLWLTVFTVYQALPGDGPREAVRRIGPWWVITSVLNIAWITAFSFSRFALAMVVMLALLVSLVIVAERVQPLADGARAATRWCVAFPFALYLAWISVAIIANTFQYAHVVQWGGFGIAESTWSAIMMGVATLLGTAMVVTRGLWLFPLVVAWALWGIGARYADVPVLHLTAQGLVGIGMVLGVMAWGWRRRRVHSAGGSAASAATA
ncbi:MAG TPA: TspO/MBR family protein [Gemmatimonadaceae bacterium]|nr:TspO/MBR family protein [Gemmatimonadaceae bacterium]